MSTMAQNASGQRVLMLLTNAFDPDPRVHAEARALIAHGFSVRMVCWDRDLKSPAEENVDGIDIERVHIPSGATERKLTRTVSGATAVTVVILLGLIVASVSTGSHLRARQ